ncbi:MAG: hypothetical protein ACP5OE_06285 [Thermodesulfobium sp.]
MKFALFSSFLSLTITTSNAGPGASKISTADIISNLPKNSYRVLKSTKGYRPPELSKPIQFQYEKMDRKVKFLDENHERYIILGKQQQFSKEDLPITERRNDHTFIITFKKRDKHEN